jgi:hypothetical protein
LSIKAALEIMISLVDYRIKDEIPLISGEPIMFASNISKESIEKVIELRDQLKLKDFTVTKVIEYVLYRAYTLDFKLGPK